MGARRIADPEATALEPGGAPSLVGVPGSSRRAALAPGEQIPGTAYRLVRWLGDGGMGVVYEAEHVDIARRVAIKVLLPEFARPQWVERMRVEARAASAVAHGGIAEVFDFLRLPDGRVAIVMEFLDGVSLDRLLDAGPVSVPRSIAILRQLCQALAAAHEAGLVHRDIKPANLVITRTRRGRRDQVKVVDFGIAAPRGSAEGEFAGTPTYMAPEQIRAQDFDHRLDIYAVGCVACHLLTGAPPFRGPTAEVVIQQQLDAQPPRLDGVPAPLRDVIARCLQKAPDDRFGTMAELELALCEAQLRLKARTDWDDLPLPEGDAAQIERLQRRLVRARRSPRRWFAAAALSWLVGGASVFAWQHFGPPAAAEGEADRIEALARAAEHAAARAFFVYPPPDAPKTATARTQLVALEDLAKSSDRALDRARSLRSQFASTLVYLGDSYWERAGGRPFAADYYIQALVFEPQHERARARAVVTEGQLASLSERAETLAFSEVELEAAAPLAALAQEDPVERAEAVREWVARGRGSGVLGAELRRLSRELDAQAGLPSPTVPGRDALAAPSGSTRGAKPAPVAEPRPQADTPAPRDPNLSKRLARTARRQLRSGDPAAARRSYEAALAADDANPAALAGLAEVHEHAGQVDEALVFRARTVALAPRNAGYWLGYGDLLQRVDDLKQARAAFIKAQELGHPAAASRLARAHE